jgi:TolB protein
MIGADGSGLRYLDFQVPGQATWQPGPFLSDGRRVVLLSMEPRRDGPGRPFEEYYTQTPTHLWLHDLDSGALTEIAHRERLAVFYTPALLLSDDRILVQVVRDRVGQLFSMNLDGTDAREFTKAGEGLPYGLSLSPDGRRVAFHLASPRGYEIWTCDPSGGDRNRVVGDPEHLYFGTSWSPDGRWILYQDCHFRTDPGHDWSDLCIGRPDGSEHRVLTRGQSQWFAATYGGTERHGGGSNMPMWTQDGGILFSRRSPGARVPWEFQAQRPDTDHFNREFQPAASRGGTDVCRLDPDSGRLQVLIPLEEGVWNCRPCPSPDGGHLAYCRAVIGEMPALWISDSAGRNPRLLSRGLEGRGADHPRWVP